MRHLTHTAALIALLSAPLAGQAHEHVEGMVHPTDAAATAPVSPGQAAFGAIAEIVARLDADPGTDWSTVDLERLRLHLVDMDLVTLRSRIATVEAPGGFVAELVGPPDVAAAIGRMTTAHAGALAADPALRVTAEQIPGGARLTVVARDLADGHAVARLRGLGAIGVMVLGNHHGPHHEAMARGADPHGGH